jgi:hypothetical protein
VGLAHSTVSGIVDRLEKRGLAQRRPNPADGRASMIVVTKMVRDYMRDAISGHRSRSRDGSPAPRQTGRARGDSRRLAHAAPRGRSHGPAAEIVILGLRHYPMANPKYAVSDRPVPVSELVATLSDGTKVKRRVPRMRACNEKDAKGKLCAGHLKRWYFFGDEVKQKFGADAEVYRCEHCKTLYLPNAEEEPAPAPYRFSDGGGRLYWIGSGEGDRQAGPARMVLLDSSEQNLFGSTVTWKRRMQTSPTKPSWGA